MTRFRCASVISRILSRSGLEKSLQYAIGQVTGYAVITVGFFLALQNTGIDLSTLTVFAGAVGVGVGVGFGLQNISSNFISGLIILAERPIRIGDRVGVHNVAGRVTDIRAAIKRFDSGFQSASRTVATWKQ